MRRRLRARTAADVKETALQIRTIEQSLDMGNVYLTDQEVSDAEDELKRLRVVARRDLEERIAAALASEGTLTSPAFSMSEQWVQPPEPLVPGAEVPSAVAAPATADEPMEEAEAEAEAEAAADVEVKEVVPEELPLGGEPAPRDGRGRPRTGGGVATT